MSYGITVLNTYGDLQMAETYPLFYSTSNTSASWAASSTLPTGMLSTDLLIGRKSVGDGARVYANSIYSSDGSTWNRSNAVSYNYFLLRKMAGNKTPPTSGMGIKILSSTGELQFASSEQKNFVVVATGEIPASTTFTSYSTEDSLPNTTYWPSSTGTVSDLDKHWVLLNNTAQRTDIYGSADFIGSLAIGYSSYEYIWTGGTAGRIKIRNSLYFAITAYGVPTSEGWYEDTTPFQYMILKEYG